MTDFDLTDLANCLDAPQVECVAPWNLERRGITLSDWVKQEKNIFVGYGVPLSVLLGPDLPLVQRRKSKWECRYRGYDYLMRYRQYVKRMWNELDELAGCTLGCYCRGNRHGCPCQILVKLYNRKQRLLPRVCSVKFI